MATISKIRAEFDARQATEAMYALSERARGLNKLLADQRKRWEETGDPKIKDTIEGNIRRLEAELSAVEKLNRTIEKSINTESAFQQVLTKGTGSMSVSRLEGAQRNARAIMRNINPSDENAINQMDEAQRVMNETGKQIASLKNGFMDAMRTVADGVEGKALPELKRLETALTEAQKFSTDQDEWNRYQEAIGKVRLEMQAATAASVQMEEQNAKAAASLKYGFEDAFAVYNKGIENMSLPELNRLEASLTEVQKFSANSEEWQKYGEAIDTVRIKIQGITGEYLSVEKAMSYGDQIRRQTFDGTIADLERAKKLLTDYRRTLKQTGEGAAELKKVDENLEVIERQIKGTYLTTEKFNEILKAPKGKSFDELKAAIEQAEKQLYGMRRETNEEREAFLKLHEQIEGAKDEMKQFDEAQEDTGIGMDGLIEKAKGLAAAYLSLQGFQKVWEANVGISDSLADVRKTTGMTAEQVEGLVQRVKEIDTRTANEQLLALSATAGQLGLSAEEDVLGFTKAANQITTALDELGNDGVLQLMKVAQVSGALQEEGGDVEKTLLRVGSSINELSAASSATAGPITDFISRVGGVASTAKISMADIAALGATTDALAISAELAGTQLNVFISGMQKNVGAVAELLNVSRDTAQAMLDNGQAMELFVQVVEKMGTLNAVELSDFLKEMGSSGSRATQVFATLSQNVDELKNNLQVSNQAYREGISITNEYNQRNESAAGMIARLKNELQEVFVQPAIINGIRMMASVAKTFLEVWSNPFVAPALNAIAVFLAGSLLGVNKLAVAVNHLKLKIAEAGSATAAFKTVFTGFFKANWPSIVLGGLAAITTGLIELYNAAKEAARQTAAQIRAFNEEKKSVDALFNPLRDHNTLQKERSELIKQINDKYGSYLSNMLTEKSTAQDIADAYALINKQLREKSILEGMEANAKKIREKRQDDLDDAFAEFDDYTMRGAANPTEGANISNRINSIVLKGIEEGLSRADIGKRVRDMVQGKVNDGLIKKSTIVTGIGYTKTFDTADVLRSSALKYYDEQIKIQEEINKSNRRLQADLDATREDITKQMAPRTQQVQQNFQTATQPQGKKNPESFSPEESRAAINAFKAMRDFYVQHREHMTKEVRKQYEASINNFDLSAHEQNAAKMATAAGSAATLTGGIESRSTDFLKKRQKDLKKMADLLEDGFDVTLLHYDEEFKKTGIDTVESAREWFDGQMKQIQTVLDERRKASRPDKPTKVTVASKQPESEAAIADLDRYYEERKQRIEIARAQENLSEMEYNRRMENMEQEHLQRRSELRRTFTHTETEEDKQLIENFRQWWENVGELGSVNWQKVETEWSKATRDDINKNNLNAARDLTQFQEIVTKQMKAIEEIIDRERPFNGITEELRKNLGTMDALLTDIEKEEERTMEKEIERTMFILEQSTKGYSLTWEQLMGEMAKRGWQAWADAIDGDTQTQQRLMHQVYRVFEKVQDAIKKEASELKKQADIMWSNILLPGGDGKTTIKDAFEQAIGALGIQEGRVSRANSLIGAGVASERVADKLAIQQLKVQLAMQQYQYSLVHKIGKEKIDMLRREAEMESDAEKARQLRMQAQNAEMALNLATRKEQTDELKLQEDIIAKTEESEARLYKELREWADLLTSSLQGVMEASHAGDAEYYNERAKLDLTGKGGPGAGTYVVIDDAGTSDATAHYEYLDERQALERQHEIEVQNAQAEAWRKLMDDLNMKMSEQITDWMNAYLQNKTTEDNTAELQRLQQKLEAEQQKMDASVTATDANTQAVQVLTQKLSEGITLKQDGTQPGATGDSDFGASKQAGYPSAPAEAPSNVDFASDKQTGYPGAQTDPANTAATDANTQAVQGLTQVIAQQGGFGADKAAGYPSGDMPSVDGDSFDTTDFAASKQAGYPSGGGELSPAAQQQINEQNAVTENFISNKQKEVQTEQQTDKKVATGAQSAFAKMTAAANLYGIAYQAMSNDNLSTEQKFQMIAVQAAGQAAISALTATMAASTASVGAQAPAVASRTFLELGPIAGPAAFAAITALLGGLLGLAVSKIAKGKSEIAQATGASVGAGRLSTGMLTYAEGNVNELTDPASLTPGRQYNVDGADGKTYRARYMGKGAKTHITNGPEFHLVGEAGPEAIIDARTTRLMRMDDTGIWRDIQTLYNGGSISGLSTRRRRGAGVAAFADGNVGEFEDALGGEAPSTGAGGMSIEMLASLQASIDRQSDLLENALTNGIKAVNKWTGSDGIPAMYNKMQKEAQRHGEKYL